MRRLRWYQVLSLTGDKRACQQSVCEAADALNEGGAHRVLQIWVQVLDGELRRSFERWYPGMRLVNAQTPLADISDRAEQFE
jgi:hypothetical protein